MRESDREALCGPPNLRSMLPPCSAGDVMERADQVLIGRVSVDRRRAHRLVPREALSEPNVAGGPVEVGAGGVAQGVEAEAAVKVGALLPTLERSARLARREAVPFKADKEWSLWVEGLPRLPLPLIQLLKFRADVIWQDHLLAFCVRVAALKDLKLNAPARATLLKDVPHIECEELMRSQTGPESEAKQDVVTEPISVLGGDVQQVALLPLREGAGRACSAVGVVGHRRSSALGVMSSVSSALS